MKSGFMRNASGFLSLVVAIALFADTPGAVGQECFVSSSPELTMIPDEHGNPVVLTTSRFLIFTAGDPDRIQAVRVSFEDLPAPFDIWNGSQLWLGPTSEVSENGASVVPVAGFPNFKAARLECEPFFTNWAELGAVSVFHEGIVASGLYRIDVIDETCDPDSKAGFSPTLNLATAKLGDVVSTCQTVPCGSPQGSRTVLDVFAILQRFVSSPTSPRKARTEMVPACLDLVTTISDVVQGVNGFQGFDYSDFFVPSTADPCDSPCVSPVR